MSPVQVSRTENEADVDVMMFSSTMCANNISLTVDVWSVFDENVIAVPCVSENVSSVLGPASSWMYNPIGLPPALVVTVTVSGLVAGARPYHTCELWLGDRWIGATAW